MPGAIRVPSDGGRLQVPKKTSWERNELKRRG